VPAESPDTTTLITTLFCDGKVRFLTFRRRGLGIRFYVMRLRQACQGTPYPQAMHPDQHIALITMVERDAHTDTVVRTLNSGFFDCEHE